MHLYVLVLSQQQSPPLPPWVSELAAALLSVLMIAFLVYWLRPTKGGAGSADFIITVDGPDVLFRGKLPERLHPTIEDFLLRDCPIDGPYEIRGRWQEQRLAISVHGDNAAPFEQRIRNFLKLQYKSPGR